MHLRRLFIIILILSQYLTPCLAGNDAQQIEELCKNGGLAELEARTYLISDVIELTHDNIEIRGKEGTVLKFADECGIPQNVPMISGKNLKNITITGVRFEGNQDKQTYALKYSNPNHPEQSGKKAYGNQVGTFIYLINCQNIKVTNCAFNDNLGDGLRLSGCKNIEFAYNTGQKGGHDTFFSLRSSYVSVHNNNIKTLVNSGCRLLSTSHVRIYDNIFSWEGPRDSGPTNQYQNDNGEMEDIEVCNNLFINSCGPGIWGVDKTGGKSEIWIHHNLFLNCGDNRISWVGGILSSGYNNMRIENNVFDGCYRASVVFYAVNAAWATEADAQLTANVFTNSREGQLDGRGPYGVDNTISKQKVKSSQNCYYNNAAGNVYGCKVSDSDIFENPKEHKTPSGWTWDGKEWSCPEVKPSEMDVPGGFEPLSDKEIEEAEQAATEFDNIFDVLSLDIVEQAGNNSVILPEGVKEPPKQVTATVTYYDNQTLVYVPSEGLTSVQVKADNKGSTHIVMLGEKQGNSVIYTNCSIWEGSHTGNSFYFEGRPESIIVTCNTPKDSFQADITTEEVETQGSIFNHWVYVYLFVLSVFLSIPFIVVYIVFKK